MVQERQKASPRGKQGRQNNPSLWTGQKEKDNLRPRSNQTKKGKGCTAEEASIPEAETQNGRWQETAATSQYEKWQADGSTWDWSAEAGWDDSEAHDQDWDNSQDWQPQASWLAVSLPGRDSRTELLSCTSGLLRRASGQVAGHIQLSMAEVTQHSFLSTKCDAQQHPPWTKI